MTTAADQHAPRNTDLNSTRTNAGPTPEPEQHGQFAARSGSPSMRAACRHNHCSASS
jgi:hypothetical protein